MFRGCLVRNLAAIACSVMACSLFKHRPRPSLSERDKELQLVSFYPTIGILLSYNFLAIEQKREVLPWLKIVTENTGIKSSS